MLPTLDSNPCFESTFRTQKLFNLYIITIIEDPEQQGFLIPCFENSPMVSEDDLCSIDCDWGQQWYCSHFPVLKRTENDEYEINGIEYQDLKLNYNIIVNVYFPESLLDGLLKTEK